MRSAPAVQIDNLRVEAGRLTMAVRLSPRAPHRTDARLAALAVAAHPTLPHHTCINESGPTFASVMEDTPLPHLLEHLIIDLQTRDPRTPADQRFVGATRWVDEAAGLARVQVSFRDDLVALQAARDAQAVLSDILERYGTERQGAPVGSAEPERQARRHA